MMIQDNQEALKSTPANGISRNPGNLVMLARRRCPDCGHTDGNKYCECCAYGCKSSL